MCGKLEVGFRFLEESSARHRWQMGCFSSAARFIFRRGVREHGQCFLHHNESHEQTRIAAMPSGTDRHQKINFCVPQVTDGITNGKCRRYAFSRSAHGVPQRWNFASLHKGHAPPGLIEASQRVVSKNQRGPKSMIARHIPWAGQSTKPM